MFLASLLCLSTALIGCVKAAGQTDKDAYTIDEFLEIQESGTYSYDIKTIYVLPDGTTSSRPPAMSQSGAIDANSDYASQPADLVHTYRDGAMQMQVSDAATSGAASSLPDRTILYFDEEPTQISVYDSQKSYKKEFVIAGPQINTQPVSVPMLKSPAPKDIAAGVPEKKLIGEGTGSVDGKDLAYKEYEVSKAVYYANFNSAGELTGHEWRVASEIIRYYIDGEAVVAWETDGPAIYNCRIQNIVSNIKPTVPAGIFDIPDNYAEITDAQNGYVSPSPPPPEAPLTLSDPK
jgi:hypothetical protein